ncbi:MAG: hypothetical protein GYB65_17705 [Chloroflexi bacterium]|nr:hypothetical protein [Chloroflexota bacterium]
MEQRTLPYNVFTYQQRMMAVLLGWAAGSITLGLLWWRGGSEWLRGLGSQFVGWGIIDGLIALGGLRGANRNAALFAAGEMDEATHAIHAQRFELILWINTGLDVLYMAFGAWLVRHFRTHDERRGMGLGIITQGAFLFVFDGVNALLLHRSYDAD